MSAISDISDYLASQGLGTVGTDIFDNYLPDNGNDAIAVIDSGGGEQEHHIQTKDIMFQVFIRGETYASVRATLDSIRGYLHQVSDRTIGSTDFLYIFAMSPGGIVTNERDSSGRGLVEASINFQAKTR